MSCNIPFLPPEIHQNISRFVDRDDLASYRLSNKMFAELGKPELFHTITLRFTRASVARLRNIKVNEELCKLVRVVIFDHNLWRVGDGVRDYHEWTRYCNMQATKALKTDPEQSALYRELAGSRDHWAAYLDRLDEEKEAVKELVNFGLVFDILTTLRGVQKIRVVNGAYRFSNWRIYRSEHHATVPVAAPLDLWKGDSFSQLNDNSTWIIPITPTTANKLRLEGITGRDLDSLYIVGGVIQHLTSIRIQLGQHVAGFHYHLHSFPVFLGSQRNLESLHIDLHRRIAGETRTEQSPRTIQDTFEISESGKALPEGPLTWPQLRKLSLRHFDSTTQALVSLVTRHSTTLRDLRLHAIGLCAEQPETTTPASWSDVLRTIEATTTLEHVALSGEFREISNRGGKLDFDDDKDYGRAVASWMVNGGDCPLAKESVTKTM
jgi:hypothetical protein